MSPSGSGAIERELTRRGFLAAGGAAAVTLAQAASMTQAAAAVVRLPSVVPSERAVRATIAAYVDTIVPGPAGGADDAPGGLEAGVLDVVYDPGYGANVVLPVLHADLQLAAVRMFGRPFGLALPYARRERIVVDRLRWPGRRGLLRGQAPLLMLYAGVAVISYVAYYGTARSDLGPEYIGFPASSSGYPDHSFGVSFATATDDGNPA